MGKVNAVQIPVPSAVTPRKQRSLEVWNRMPGSFAPFLPEAMKDDIAATGTTFTILGCNLREKTQFGPCWMVDIELGGQQFTIAFSSADYRDETMDAVRQELRDGGPFEATLRAFDTVAGHGWSLASPDYEESEGADKPTF